MKLLRYEVPYFVPYQEVDFTGKWKMSEMFNVFSNVATSHAELLGVWKKEYINQYGWVLAKMHVDILSPITFEQNITIQTWPGEPSRATFPRYYAINNAQGERVVNACGIWTLLDLVKRRIAIPSRVGMDYPKEVDPEVNSVMPQVSEFNDYHKVMERKVCYSDLDTNQHMNNTRYIQWAFDLLDIEKFKEGYICSLDIFYKKEAQSGTVIDLYTGIDDEFFYVLGKDDENECFSLKGKWKTLSKED